MMLCPRCLRQFSRVEPVEFCPDDNSLLYQLPAELSPGSIIDERYRVEAPVGLGGWSIVYKGLHVRLNIPVAIKVLLPTLVRNPEKFKRFKLEAQLASALDHPNIVKIHDYGVLPKGPPFIVMDFINGKDLSELIESGPIPASQAIQIFCQVCDGMEAAHQAGLVHRDLKPSNIVITSAPNATMPQIKIVDFGVSKLITDEFDSGEAPLTRTGDSLGTPHYMSPEQCLGQSVDVRSDIYSFGCVMYECLTGRTAVGGNSAFECMTNQVTSVPLTFKQANPAVRIPSALEEIVFVSLEKAPESRFQTMKDLGDHLRALDSEGHRTWTPQIIWRKPSALKRKEDSATLAIAASVFAIFAFVFYQIAQPKLNAVRQPQILTQEAVERKETPGITRSASLSNSPSQLVTAPPTELVKPTDKNGSTEAQSQDLVQGIDQYNRGLYSSAILSLSKAQYTERANPTAHYYLANCLLRTGNKEGALREYEIARMLEPNGTIAQYAAKAINQLSNKSEQPSSPASIGSAEVAPYLERELALPPVPTYMHDVNQPSVAEVSAWAKGEQSQYLQTATDNKSELESRVQEIRNVLNKAESLVGSAVPTRPNYGESESEFQFRKTRTRVKAQQLLEPYKLVVDVAERDLQNASRIYDICLAASRSQ